jgi:hypothetical protein
MSSGLSLNWGDLSLPDLWSNAADSGARQAAQHLIKVVSQRAVPIVEEELAIVRASVIDEAYDVDSQLVPQQNPTADDKRILSPPVTNLRISNPQPALSNVLSCYVQRHLLTPVAARQQSEAQRGWIDTNNPDARRLKNHLTSFLDEKTKKSKSDYVSGRLPDLYLSQMLGQNGVNSILKDFALSSTEKSKRVDAINQRCAPSQT